MNISWSVVVSQSLGERALRSPQTRLNELTIALSAATDGVMADGERDAGPSQPKRARFGPRADVASTSE